MDGTSAASPPARSGRDLIRATLPFAVEDRARSWRLLLTTLGAMAAATVATGWAPIWLQPAGSVLIALLLVRAFIFLHDAEHGALFRGSPLGLAVVRLVAMYTLNTPPIWRVIHDLHHRTNAQPLDLPLDQYRRGDLLNRTVTLEQWAEMSPKERRVYRVVNHPLIFVFGFFTAFVYSHGLAPLFSAKREWRGALAVAAWFSAAALLVGALGWQTMFFCFFLPNFLGSALGVYLFYAQHHFPDAQISPAGSWNLTHGALRGSSFFEMPALLHWFTGNIGYHHVHHVNHRIPFYRLPDAMAAIAELQSPGRTSFAPRDVLACLRSNIWDERAGRLISIADADRAIAEHGSPSSA